MVGSRMNFESPGPAQSHGSLLVLAALALLVGRAAGALGALFRLALEHTKVGSEGTLVRP